MPNDKRFDAGKNFFCGAKSTLMKQLPFYIPAVFILATLVTIYVFYRASQRNNKMLLFIFIWLVLQSVIALSGFFTTTNNLPPRFVLLLIVPAVSIIAIVSSRRGRAFADVFNVRQLTALHSVRIAIELVLYWLFLYKGMPKLMTFEGRNLDLLSGLTAPLIYYFGFVTLRIATKTIVFWNFACLFILLFTVGNAVLSAPTPFQQFAFDQPAVAVLHFPFVWLPGIIVPVVIFSHIAAIRILLKKIKRPVAQRLVSAS